MSAGPGDEPPPTADAVVVGAGLVGACCAAYLARSGLRVCVVDRTAPTAGSTASGEGNVLVSDKLPGPELALALRSLALWRRFADTGGDGFELERKGGMVVAHDEGQMEALRRLAEAQRPAGVEAEEVDPAGLRALEPRISPHLAGGMFYPGDAQVQPMLATAAHLAAARAKGAVLAAGAEVLRAETTRDGRLAALVTSRGRVGTRVVVNAAGPWSAAVAQRCGTSLPVRPRRGHVLVTEPLPRMIRHKVYEADYVDTVGSDDEALACSAVVEGTASGTVLIGSSREYVGFDRTPSTRVLAEMARRAFSLFPFLTGVRALRTYVGFRPASPDHLPLIGPDPHVTGLYHASGHEGAGIGLAPATGELVAALVGGAPAPVDPAPFAPARVRAARTSGGTHG